LHCVETKTASLKMLQISEVFSLQGEYVITYTPLTLYSRRGSRDRYSSETPTAYQNYLAVRNTADSTGGKLIAVLLQSILGVSAIYPLVAFYDIHGGKREVLFFCSGTDNTRSQIILLLLRKFWNVWIFTCKLTLFQRKKDFNQTQ
jgi:hypothetical protein